MIEILAQEGVNNFGDTRGGGLAGPTGLFIIVLLVIATVLLIRNMNKRLKRLPAEFPHPDEVHRARKEAKQAKKAAVVEAARKSAQDG